MVMTHTSYFKRNKDLGGGVTKVKEYVVCADCGVGLPVCIKTYYKYNVHSYDTESQARQAADRSSHQRSHSSSTYHRVPYYGYCSDSESSDSDSECSECDRREEKKEKKREKKAKKLYKRAKKAEKKDDLVKVEKLYDEAFNKSENKHSYKRYEKARDRVKQDRETLKYKEREEKQEAKLKKKEEIEKQKLKQQAYELNTQGINASNLHDSFRFYLLAHILNPSEKTYIANMYMVQAELSIKAGDYDKAITEAQQAIATDSRWQGYKNTLVRALNEKEQNIKQIIVAFDNIITQKMTPEVKALLKEFSIKLGKLLDQNPSDSSVGNRFLIGNLRIERYQLKMQLESEESNKKTLMGQIETLLADEVKFLDELGIEDVNLRRELAELQERLTNMVENPDIDIVDLNDIGQAAVELGEQVEHSAQEKLAHRTHQEKGDGAATRKYLIGDAFESYYMSAIDKLLALRLNKLSQVANREIKTLSAQIIKDEQSIISIGETLTTYIRDTQEHNRIIVPLLIRASVESGNHWVGIVLEKQSTQLVISYLDSENGPVSNVLKSALVNRLEYSLSKYQILFRQILVEEQRYNNCGPELIENFVYYLTGTRSTQKAAIYVHSMLLENSLLNPEIYNLQIEENDKLLGSLSNSISIFENNEDEKVQAQLMHYYQTGELFTSANQVLTGGHYIQIAPIVPAYSMQSSDSDQIEADKKSIIIDNNIINSQINEKTIVQAEYYYTTGIACTTFRSYIEAQEEQGGVKKEEESYFQPNTAKFLHTYTDIELCFVSAFVMQSTASVNEKAPEYLSWVTIAGCLLNSIYNIILETRKEDTSYLPVSKEPEDHTQTLELHGKDSAWYMSGEEN